MLLNELLNKIHRDDFSEAGILLKCNACVPRLLTDRHVGVGNISPNNPDQVCAVLALRTLYRGHIWFQNNGPSAVAGENQSVYQESICRTSQAVTDPSNGP